MYQKYMASSGKGRKENKYLLLQNLVRVELIQLLLSELLQRQLHTGLVFHQQIVIAASDFALQPNLLLLGLATLPLLRFALQILLLKLQSLLLLSLPVGLFQQVVLSGDERGASLIRENGGGMEDSPSD